jgi:phosphate/sulfate permease
MNGSNDAFVIIGAIFLLFGVVMTAAMQTFSPGFVFLINGAVFLTVGMATKARRQGRDEIEK